MELVLISSLTVVSLGLIFLCLVGLVKNEIIYRIRMRWIDEKYVTQLHSLELPSYMATFFDITLWWYVPLEEYLNKKKNNA